MNFFEIFALCLSILWFCAIFWDSLSDRGANDEFRLAIQETNKILRELDEEAKK